MSIDHTALYRLALQRALDRLSLSPAPAMVCVDASGQSLCDSLALVSASLDQMPDSPVMHWVWLGSPASFAAQAAQLACFEAVRWPAALIGLHRLVLRGGRLHLTIGLGDRCAMVAQLVIQADVVLHDDRIHAGGLVKPDGLLVNLVSGCINPAVIANQHRDDLTTLWLDQATVSSGKSVAVVGAGIAGLTTAAVLAQAGWRVTVIDPTDTHQGHAAAALTPVISSGDNERSRLSRAGTLLADSWWRSLGSDIGRPCGALQLQRRPDSKRPTDLKAQAAAFGMPDWARWVDAGEASALAGVALDRGAIWYPYGWLIKVPQLLSALQSTPGVTRTLASVYRLQAEQGGWTAYDANGHPLAHADVIVCANAFDVLGLFERSGLGDGGARWARLDALHRLAGEVTNLPLDRLGESPECILGGDGYILPAVDGFCVSGGTYVRGADQAVCTEEGRQANLERAADLVSRPALTKSFDAAAVSCLPGWAGWRAVLPGRLPAIGPIAGQPGLWVFTAGASRGLTWSVLGASLIRDALDGVPLLLESDLLAAIRS